MEQFTDLIVIILCLGSACQSEFVTNIRRSYDYVIVGGGTSGNVLANRLSSNPAISVLLLEAGSIADELSNIPISSLSLQRTELDWSYKSVPQERSCWGLKNNRTNIPRGKGLGGSSLINFMLFARGNKKDYDNWAANGAHGWSWDDVFPYFIKWENNKDDFIASNGYHGTRGEMSISRPSYYTPLAQAYLDAAKEVGHKEGDYNGPDPETFMLAQGFLKNGSRCSTFEAFIKPVANRKNLHIVTEALATKILFDSNKRVVAVEFEHKHKTKVARVSKEALVAAGAINSPQLLMLSGIGPRENLQKLGISVIADLPVGKNLQDHVTVGVPFTLEEPVAFKVFDVLVLGLLPYIFRKGPLTSMTVETIGFFSTKYNNQSNWPDIEFMFASISPASDDGLIGRLNYGMRDEVWEKVFRPNIDIHTFMCMPLLMHPESIGDIKIASKDPHEPPLINPNYFDKPQDMKVLVEGMKMCLKIISATPMKKFGARPFRNVFPGCEKYQQYSDEYLECVARVFTLTNYHPVGTCKMGDPRDPTTVVDPRLRVKGVKGLRVVDVSIMPKVNTGHTEAPAIMIGEKGADIILNEF